MILLIKLLIAHFIGDFIFQPTNWVKDKEDKIIFSDKLYYHIIIHLVLMLIILQDKALIGVAFFIAITHFIVDISKLYFINNNKKRRRKAFLGDQVLHLIIILLVVHYHEPLIQIPIQEDIKSEIYLLLLALIALIPVSSRTIKILISKWSPETITTDTSSLEDAGNYIGILERLFIFGFILIGQIQAIGFLLAAKSVFRFGDLKGPTERKLTEYILIGTLLSFGIAILIGFGYLKMKEEVFNTK